jgi:hypothetical protein
LKKLLSIVFSALFIVSCGGGGGGGGSTPTTPSTPPPTVNLSAEPTSALLESTSTLTWSSANATSCSASWTSQTGTSGSEVVTISSAGNNSFSISCTGDGGTRSASVTVEGYRETDGVVVDGYISGAEVCIDEDESWTCDSNENTTTSDNEGKFTIRYSNGNLVSIGGTDLDSQTLLDNFLITHKLNGHSEFKAVTPVTSVAAFMEDASLVNAALGIDSSIDVFTFDPVANKGDGGIYDYLYEKGNQLTVLAFALQNITNNLNITTETTQDYFKAITEEIEKEYTENETKVDIETEAFITNVVANVIAAKSVTIDETAKANTTKALAGVLPVIEVKSSDELTTGVIRFAVSTLQTDIQAIANGTATAETVTSYTSDVLAYIAEDQNIDSNEIAPDISAIADSATTSEDTSIIINVVANDSYLTSAPISVIAGNGTNGITSIAEPSPEQITYEPNADYYGTDTFSYTITQGDKTSSAEVTVTVSAVNDEPSIDIASTIQVPENQTAVTTVSVSDVDEDELTLTLGGTDASSFNLSGENVLTFKEEPDYETKTSYGITLSLTDGTETVTKDLTIAITNVNDVAPEFTSDATFSADENQTAIDTVTATDAEGDEVTFTVSGSELAITSAGVLTFVSAPDYETKTTYTATVTASDGTNSTTQSITVNVTDVNEAPVFTSNATFSVAENQTAIGTVTATDDDGDEVTFTVSGSELEITSTGVLTFASAPDYEAKTTYTATVTASDGTNATTQAITVNVTDVNEAPVFTSNATFSVAENQTAIGTVTATDDDGDEVTLTVSGSEITINSSSGVIAFTSAPDYETKTSYLATITVSDGTNSTTQAITVNVTNVNDNTPVIITERFDFDENQTEIGQLEVTDADGDDLTFTIQQSEFSISSTGMVTADVNPDCENTDADGDSSIWVANFTRTFYANDGENSTDKQIWFYINCINDNSPSFTSSATFSAAENQTAIGAVTATDADRDSVTFTVSGSELAITSAGVLTFVSAPDYETKTSYSATVTASDGTNSTTQDITVNVTNVNDVAPEFTSEATFSAEENQTAIGTVVASDADGDGVVYSISGSEITINPSSGVITFVSAPDYETKTSYSATVTASDGINSSTQNIRVNVSDLPDSFIGEVIDGYIFGAEIFIDQNFNFNKDEGEYSTSTLSDGSFVLNVEDTGLYECLENRPIIANVPVGAIDSSLGEVTQSYQMILPSISDTGNSRIVISPFTSLFAEAVLSSKSGISEDLTVDKGCQSEGDNIAEKISTRIDELKTSIESNFGFSYEQLISDFIENPTDNVDETSAQNIAKLLPYLQIIDNQVSQYLTDTFEKDIRANVSLSEDSLSIIFGGSSYEKLPLDFYSNYATRPNSEGWFRSETLEASGANISKEGILSREDCSENDTTLCNINILSLDNIANASTSYTRTSSFTKSTPIDFDELGIANGSLSVSASLSSSWRNNSDNWNQPNNRSRECQKQESINFTSGDQVDPSAFWTQFSYSTYSQGFEKADCNDTRHYYTPILNASTYTNNGSGVSVGAQYYIFDVLRSGISSNLPYDFVNNSVTINPELVVKDIATLPRMFKDLDNIRSLFRGDDYILFNYGDSDGQAAIFEAGTSPSNDMFENRRLGTTRIYGQPARTAFYNLLKDDPNLNNDFYGDSAPINTSILGRIANSYIEIIDYSGSSEIVHQITPAYDYVTQTLDYSLVSALDLENIKDFIQNGINGNPLNAKIWFNPDSSINSTVPIKLFLYEGDDTNVDANEGFFEMSFNLIVSSSASGDSNSYESSQLWTIEAGAEILVSYTEDGITLSQTVVNVDEDKITLTDSNTGDTSDNLDSYINQPTTLNLKLVNLISKVSDKIAGIQNFFIDGGIYTIKLDLESGGHSLVGFNRNTVKSITGTFKTKSSPDYAINVNDIIIKEGDSKDICFNRSSIGDLSYAEFDLSFTQRERPGKGGFADDFTLSDTTIVFDENDTQSCVVFTATKDTHFDWAHDIYLDISDPSNGQSISRSRMKITILDIYFPNRIDWRRK